MNNFYTLLMGNFARSMILPQGLINFLNEVDPEVESLVLVSRKGTWEVSVRHAYAGHPYAHLCLFGDVWEQYVAAHELVEREVIIFEQVEGITFNTTFFGVDNCEKMFEDDDEDGDGGNEIPRFHTALEYGYVGIPTLFARENNLMRNMHVELRSDTGGTWPARIEATSYGHLIQVRLSGMHDFIRDNLVSAGVECIFELVYQLTDDTVVFNVMFLN